MINYDKNKMLKIKILWIFLAAIVFLIGAVWWVITPSEKDRAMFAEEEQRRCLDNFCQGDVVPKSSKDEILLKINNQWFIGPREYSSMGRRGYFSEGRNGAVFFWPKKISDFEIEKSYASDKFEDFSEIAIEIFFRSYAIPPEPRGFNLIKFAENNHLIASRKILRQGLEGITMKHVMLSNGYYFDHVTYYVATDLVDLNGFPPVATCSHSHSNDSGGTGFLWKPGIWVGIRMNQKHCADWPEIYQEIQRVIQLLKKVEQ